MIQIQLKITPEPELFRHLQDSKEIKSYCSGEKGLLIFTGRNDMNNNNQQISFQSTNENTKENKIISKDNNIVTFTCNCLNNPPNMLRKIIHSLDGLILDPVTIKNDWEYMDIVFDGEHAISNLTKQLNEYYEFNIIKSNHMKERRVFLKSNIDEILTFLTTKQKETLIEAWKNGYYKIPRQASTEELSSRDGTSRYAYEKKLRTAENKLMDKLIPILLLY